MEASALLSYGDGTCNVLLRLQEGHVTQSVGTDTAVDAWKLETYIN